MVHQFLTPFLWNFLKDSEVILCKVPHSRECAVYITNIKWNDSLENLWFEVYTILSHYGLIYNVYVSPSKYDNENHDRYFVLARFYSPKAASTVFLHSQKIKINGRNVKISKISHNSENIKNWIPYSHYLKELIAFYFGFNYWSSEILFIQNESKKDDPELKYVCSIRITTRDHLRSDAVGYGVAAWDPSQRNTLGRAHMTARRFAIENATSKALSKFVIVDLGNGKRWMEIDTTIPDDFHPALSSHEDVLIKETNELDEDPEEEEDPNDFLSESSEWIGDISDSLLDHYLAC